MEAAAIVTLASDSIALCAKVITELKKFARAENDLRALIQHVEKVRQSSELLSLMIPDMSAAGYGDFSAIIDPCTRLRPLLDEIMVRASEVAGGQPKLGILRKIKWTLGSSTTDDLVQKLQVIQGEIAHSASLLTLWASMRNLAFANLGAVTAEGLDVEPKLRDVFSTASHDPSPETMAGELARTWLGVVTTESHDQAYCLLRDQLATAAKFGDWENVFHLIDIGWENYNESWVNSFRLASQSNRQRLSLWAPLHQAVYTRAPTAVFEKLLERCASKTLRTRRSELSWDNMSPLELALEMGVSHAVRLLQPTIRSPIPTDTLQQLEQQFHALIRYEIYGRLEESHLHLPILEPLTEFESSPTWFPIRILGPRAGYMYQLDSRHLLVWSANITSPRKEAKYRITDAEILVVDEALTFTIT